ncbi:MULTISPECIES: hypothetical protein [Rhizobium]|uniref:Antitoxin ParD1/3/4 n=1 Tax=Rhizobium tropici TaxID=398 RepID=A0A6P1CDT4_RHITR|nr:MULTISPECIES: hypothetical protein [Rhizobium]AGB70260.1 hypothetical protein RTCIAT899_CH04240 [Rhizobium tropici CIAT 899]MBB4239342.1 antitoxin ParD1/3/4 [Rhizobium tropici]MBB5590612.1 antitoxin ParD1/3/4 [Rhizobium tropici]MBB6490179.1 antitoxin ParD1/3/4 [Rhizobium tropici]NEV14997.1 hypothetical protein [Rhizobium tropici]
MNVKTEITLSERHLRLAEKMVEEGAFPSISRLVEAAIEQIDQVTHHDTATDDVVTGMADEIRQRMELPDDQWLPWDGKEVASRVKDRLRQKYAK